MIKIIKKKYPVILIQFSRVSIFVIGGKPAARSIVQTISDGILAICCLQEQRVASFITAFNCEVFQLTGLLSELIIFSALKRLSRT